jgi:hypothetical protein
MPTATDLVTDLPADFEVFGQAVATSMADLLGGTSGQILAKNSNTDMDFVWIANDQGDITGITASSPLTGGGTSGAITVGIQDGTTAQKGAVQLENSTSSTSTTTAAVPASVKSAYDLANGAIPKSLIDAAGDLIVGTAADTAGRLGIGTAGQVLKVNSGATALEWATDAAGMTNPMTTTGDTIYSSSGSTPARLGIGTTGQVLTVAGGIPSWATPGGSLANYAQIGSTTNLSGSSVTFSSISGKDSLFIYINNAKSSSSANINVYFNGFGPADYTYSGVQRSGTSACEFGGSTGDDEFTLGGSGGTNSLRGFLTLFGAGSTGIKPVTFTGSISSGSNNLSQSADGFYFGASAITSVTIACSAGSFNSGTVALYGA